MASRQGRTFLFFAPHIAVLSRAWLIFAAVPRLQRAWATPCATRSIPACKRA